MVTAGRAAGLTTVIGANGFLGARVVRQLVESGETTRVLVRASSDTRDLDELDVERVVGDLSDHDAVSRAMRGADRVIYCAVDTRAWLRDPEPLRQTNIDLLGGVLDVAAGMDLERFIFTSSMCTIGRVSGRLATEDDEFNWASAANPYILSRVAGERVALAAVARGVPVVAMCVSNTYGAGDWKPTPHGAFVAGAALGRLPFGISGMRAETVGVTDAADALVQASHRGRVGERYIVSSEFLDLRDVITIAATEAGQKLPRPMLRRPAMYALGAAGDVRSRLTGTSQKLSVASVRLMHQMSPMDHRKATAELDWHPAPVADSIRAAARYWVDRRKSSATR